ncbi:MAG: hypothetical protein OHK0022_58500 [Roseiflexaceae bacterium]
MSTNAIPTLDQALALARRLSPQDRATLIARLAQELVTPVVAPTPPASDVWARWTALRNDIEREHPNARLADRLHADRQERNAALGETSEEDDVHP